MFSTRKYNLLTHHAKTGFMDVSLILFRKGFVGKLLTTHFPAAQMPSQKVKQLVLDNYYHNFVELVDSFWLAELRSASS